MKEKKILKEIMKFCEERSNRECCSEEECVLWRIEQITLGLEKKQEFIAEGQLSVFDCIDDSNSKQV